MLLQKYYDETINLFDKRIEEAKLNDAIAQVFIRGKKNFQQSFYDEEKVLESIEKSLGNLSKMVEKNNINISINGLNIAINRTNIDLWEILKTFQKGTSYYSQLVIPEIQKP